MESNDKPKFLAFKKISGGEAQKPKEKSFERVFDKSLSIDEDSNPYEEMDFLFMKEISGEIRPDSGLKLLTSHIVETFKRCKKDFHYEEQLKPRRELTSPCEGVYNEGRDNEEFNLIVSVQDEITSPKDSYEIIDLIGQGISGQVFKCVRKSDEKPFAIKVIKNKKAYKNQALIELKILDVLNNQVDKQDMHHLIRFYDHFCYKEHLCIIFELLNENIYELLKQNFFEGLSFNTIRFIMKQILEAVHILQKVNLIHCDLKPENILLKIDKDNLKNEVAIKITDFGSACFKNHTMFQYIQSRYYRAPEVIVGNKYSQEIDLWSCGCIAAELFLGGPIFPGSCEYDQLAKITKLIGRLPFHMLREARNTRKYYKVDQYTRQFRMKTSEEYYKEYPNDAQSKYEIPLELECLDDLLEKGAKKKTSLNSSVSDVNNTMEAFVHFLKGLLTVDPTKRWNAKQSLKHPFITKERFEPCFNPNQEEISNLWGNSFEGGSFMSESVYARNRAHQANMYNSMMCNVNPYFSNTCSQNTSLYSNYQGLANSSLDMSCYQPNLRNIPINMIKQFPYARLDDINLKREVHPKKNEPSNRTFMQNSFERIHSNNSYNSDYNFFKQKRRVIRDNIANKKNKFDNFALQNKIKQNLNHSMSGDKFNSDQGSANKSLFFRGNLNFNEFASCSNPPEWDSNKSFDLANKNRERSFSDNYKKMFVSQSTPGSGLKQTGTQSNLNYSNYSTQEQINKKSLGANETPINSNCYPKQAHKTEGKNFLPEDKFDVLYHSNEEIKEEEQTDDGMT